MIERRMCVRAIGVVQCVSRLLVVSDRKKVVWSIISVKYSMLVDC